MRNGDRISAIGHTKFWFPSALMVYYSEILLLERIECSYEGVGCDFSVPFYLTHPLKMIGQVPDIFMFQESV